MKLSISNIGWSSENDEKVYSLMKNIGFSGLEIAPTRIFPENPYDKLKEAKEWKKELFEKYGFDIPSMQSIWYGRQERIFGSKEERQKLIDYTKKAIDFAVAIECKNLVFGCPRNRSLQEGENEEIAFDFFKELGDYAYNVGIVIGMEANPTIYNTNYINNTKSALDLIKKVDSKGFLLNFDLGTVIYNSEDIAELVNNVKYINHAHISEPSLKPIEKRDIHKKLRNILEKEDYSKYISIEMGKQDDLVQIENIMRYVYQIVNF